MADNHNGEKDQSPDATEEGISAEEQEIQEEIEALQHATDSIQASDSTGTPMIADTTEQMLEYHNHCPLCGVQLQFNHQADFAQSITHETAKCPECRIRIRKSMHRLH